MARPRKHLVCLSETPYYHVTSRCVRRAFLCGVDKYNGKSYEHRRAWVEDRIRVLSSVFHVEVCAYAVMSNHFHLVVRLKSVKRCDWSGDEVLKRWTSLFRGPLLVQQYRAGKPLTAVELDSLHSMTAIYRNRLHSLSWFMKCLNEPIARQANAEDGCTGHFWEARFQSQPLCSEKALFSAMAYVDLNPVRAGTANRPETSGFTSIRARMQGKYRHKTLCGAVERLLKRDEINHFDVPVRALIPFSARDPAVRFTTDPLPMYEQDYFQLVEATGRAIRSGKPGRIDPGLAPVLDRLGLSPDQWTKSATAFHLHYRNGDLRPVRSA